MKPYALVRMMGDKNEAATKRLHGSNICRGETNIVWTRMENKISVYYMQQVNGQNLQDGY